MAKRDDERALRRAVSGSEEALARIERETVRRGNARYRVIVPGRKPGEEPPSLGAEPVMIRRGIRDEVPAWSFPVVTAAGVWSALRDHGSGVFHDSVTEEVLVFDRSASRSTEIYRVKRLEVPAIAGVWTPTADVVCVPCEIRRPGSRFWAGREHMDPIFEVPESKSVTNCDVCGANIVVEWTVGNEHRMVLALREALGGAPGFATPLAAMEQTGGMCSAFSVRFEDEPRLSLWFVIDEESKWSDPVFLPWLEFQADDSESGETAGLPGSYRTVDEIARLALALVDPGRRRAAYRENARSGHD